MFGVVFVSKLLPYKPLQGLHIGQSVPCELPEATQMAWKWLNRQDISGTNLDIVFGGVWDINGVHIDAQESFSYWGVVLGLTSLFWFPVGV